jgi:ABC-type nitrate/sulfonate/bicarbonate transport system substrate-binding protein
MSRDGHKRRDSGARAARGLLHTRGIRAALSLGLVIGLGSAAVACGGDDGGGSGAAAGASAEKPLRIAHTSSVDPGEIAGYVAPIEYGDKVGLVKTGKGDLETFDSHATATQVLLSGKADIIGGSFVSDLQVIERGVPIKSFCPMSSGFAAVIVGRDEVTDLQYLADHKDTPVAIESAGGPVNFFFDLVLAAKGTGMTTQEFTDAKILEDSPERVSALANGDVKATLINFFQLPDLQKQLGGKLHVLSDVMADVGQGGIFLTFAARQDWLDKNRDTAARFCASVLTANKALTEDFDAFKAMADKYITPKVDEATLRTNWEAVKKYELFPFGNSLTPEAVDQVVQTAVKTGILKEGVTYDQAVDSAVVEQAVKLVGEQG